MASLHLQHSCLSPLTTKKPTSYFPSNSKPPPSRIFFSFATPSNNAEPTPPEPSDRVRLAFERARQYKKALEEAKISKLEQNPVEGSGGGGGGDEEVPDSLKAAMEKAEEYKTNKGVQELGTNSDADMPEVKIIVGQFGDTSTSLLKPIQEDNSELYKPKVSSWGVFPRPGNISKTYGGGKTIRPGDMLETAEERAAKDERSRKLLEAYRGGIGLNIDPKLKLECEKALEEGDSLMDSGKLVEALPYYKKVMDKLVFESKLHGVAALQWSICMDSLGRSNEARVMYEKLESHPNAEVSKKARHFVFSFQAIEMMKVKQSSLGPESLGYQRYFEAFVEDKRNYPVEEASSDEGTLGQILPYVIFLASPIFIVLFVAAQRGTVN